MLKVWRASVSNRTWGVVQNPLFGRMFRLSFERFPTSSAALDINLVAA